MNKIYKFSVLSASCLILNLGYALNHQHTKVTHHKLPVKHSKTHHKTHSSNKHKSFNYMRGIASYYGDNDGFNGRLMANGLVFDEYNSHYAAHPTLPLGTKLKVTNLANGRSIYVDVTDRMPKEGRVIDLSTQAGLYLGMHHRGITHVQLKVISDRIYQANKNNLEVNDDDDGHQY